MAITYIDKTDDHEYRATSCLMSTKYPRPTWYPPDTWISCKIYSRSERQRTESRTGQAQEFLDRSVYPVDYSLKILAQSRDEILCFLKMMQATGIQQWNKAEKKVRYILAAEPYSPYTYLVTSIYVYILRIFSSNHVRVRTTVFSFVAIVLALAYTQGNPSCILTNPSTSSYASCSAVCHVIDKLKARNLSQLSGYVITSESTKHHGLNTTAFR